MSFCIVFCNQYQNKPINVLSGCRDTLKNDMKLKDTQKDTVNLMTYSRMMLIRMTLIMMHDTSLFCWMSLSWVSLYCVSFAEWHSEWWHLNHATQSNSSFYCHLAKCHFMECRSAECHGALIWPIPKVLWKRKRFFTRSSCIAKLLSIKLSFVVLFSPQSVDNHFMY